MTGTALGVNEMPVEIRELTIKTRIVDKKVSEVNALSGNDLALLKQKIVQECLKTIRDKTQKNGFDR